MGEQIRVLHVVTHMNRGGLETMLMNYYRHIDRSCVQFDFLVHRNEQAAYDDEIRALGGRIYRMPRLVPWSIGYKKALSHFFKTHDEYKIVHVHQDCLSSVILKEAEKCGIPVRIAHSHNASQDKDIKYPIKLFYKRSIPKYATALFACGQAAGAWMFGGAPFDLLTNAIDTEAYRYNIDVSCRIRKELSIPKEAFVIGHVGRFSPQKNHLFLIDVFAQIAFRDPNARLLLVGDGNLRAEIEAKLRSLDLSEKVILTGVRNDVPALLQAMDAFVFPSVYEGLPVTMVEAQASGLPCIISDKIPTDCVVTDLVQTALLTESPKKWAEYILSVKGTPRRDTVNEVASAGFDIAENAKRLEAYYISKQKENG